MGDVGPRSWVASTEPKVWINYEVDYENDLISRK